MRHIELRRSITQENRLASDPLPCKYPLIYADSENVFDISLVITDYVNEQHIPSGIYHFNQLNCTCLQKKIGVLHRVQSVFKRRLSQSWSPTPPCQLHSLNHDIILESHKSLNKIKQTLPLKLSFDDLPYTYPLIYADSEEASDISLLIKNQQNHIPPGIYHFNHVSCTCPSQKTDLLERIQSIVTKKSSQTWKPTHPCNLHSLNYDILLEFYTLKKT